jgi:pyridoxine 5-phosphate synthase
MRLAVNIDHIATIREARKSDEPDPVAAAAICELAGAQGITVHLRGDRRHIQDRDAEILARTVSTHLNVEMAASPEMVRVAQTVKPHQVTLVPERRDELTTEGGLDVLLHSSNIDKTVRQLLDAGIDVSIFVDPDLEQLRQCQKLRVPKVEINTGKFAEAFARRVSWSAELEKVTTAAKAARKMGLGVLAGHGLNYRNIDSIAVLTDIEELNIGHSIVARAALVGLERAVREMVGLMRKG